jgi:NAD(P)-dependent dehydrogenase (short-subunit alcohol dehydrogenase family)
MTTSTGGATTQVDLSGQVALVTGAGRGIGQAIAEALAAAGAAVSLVARTEHEIQEVARGIAARGGQAIAISANVADQEAVERTVAETTHRLGPVTLLVNDAGTPGPVGPMWKADPAEWWECIEVIVRGTFLCSNAVLPGMLERGGGRIVHVASTSGVTGGGNATSVAKTAQIRMAEGLANQVRQHGISVFAIHPGVVRTRLLLSYKLPVFEAPDYPFTPPERAGDLCVRLASGRYDALSGRFLKVEDDLDALLERAEEIKEQDLLVLRLKQLDPDRREAALEG